MKSVLKKEKNYKKMTNFDVFNGDTDGIFAWHQLRLTHPREAVIVTGVKRDVGLLSKVDATEGDLVTVMDVSYAKNRKDVGRLLDSGAIIEYFDQTNPIFSCLDVVRLLRKNPDWAEINKVVVRKGDS